MIKLSSIASGAASVLVSGLILFATLAPVPASAQSDTRMAAVSADMLTGFSAKCSVALL